jgi:hypothetical protein
MVELVYFLHIPKTAGTSMHRVLATIFGPERCTAPLLWDQLLERGPDWDAGLRCVIGHFGGLLPLYAGRRPLRLITMLREPVARALSHINHVQRDPNHPYHAMAQGLAIAEYCHHPMLRKTVENYQAHYLASLACPQALGLVPGVEDASRSVAFEEALYATSTREELERTSLKSLDAFAAVGICERFADSSQLFAQRFGYSGELPFPQENQASSDQPKLEAIAPEDLTLLRELTQIDQAVYAAGVGRLERDLQAAKGLPGQ